MPKSWMGGGVSGFQPMQAPLGDGSVPDAALLEKVSGDQLTVLDRWKDSIQC